MEECEYSEVPTNNGESFKRKYFLRQLFICSGAWTTYFMLGLCTGAPTVLVPQLRKDANSTAAVSEEMASWLPATISYASLPWVFVLPSLVKVIGRKKPQFLVCLFSFVGYIIFCCSKTAFHVLISELFQGLVVASYLTISLMILTEYTSKKYRGVFLTCKSAMFFWGILFSNTIGTFFHWKYIGVVGLICSIYTVVTIFFWPESPLWLATKGNYDLSAKSHRWLKGTSEDAEKELDRMISGQKELRNNLDINTKTLKEHIINSVKKMLKKKFYKPVSLSILLLALYLFSGKLVCTIYAIDIIKKITNSESTAYIGMLVLDGITVISMYIGCFLTRILKRRSMLLASSSVGILFLYLLSLYLYLIKLTVLTENKYASISLLTGFSISIGCGPMILSTSILGELLPLDSRSTSICVIALCFKLMYGTFIKVSPYFFKLLGLHGTFFLYGNCSAVCLFLIYKYIPETKDKTLQEIADCLIANPKISEAAHLINEEKKISNIVRNFNDDKR